MNDFKTYTVTAIRHNSHMGTEYHDGNTIFCFGNISAKIGDKVKIEVGEHYRYERIWVNDVLQYEYDEQKEAQKLADFKREKFGI